MLTINLLQAGAFSMLFPAIISQRSFNMQKKFRIAVPVSTAIVIAVWAVLARIFGEYDFYGTAWSLLPPVTAIALALITKEVYSSLFAGIFIGAVLYSGFDPVNTVDNIINNGFISGVSDPWNVGIFLFLVILGIMVALINKAGGSAAFGEWTQAHIKSRAGALFATFILGVLIFVDDYFNCLTVGSVMCPLTDTHKISRAKLAYIIDATAAPVCMIAPISSWAAAVSGMVDGQDGISLFVRAIPFNFYSLLTFVFVIAIIFMKFDYGSMRNFEERASKGLPDLSDSQKETENTISSNPNGKVYDLVIPILILIFFCITGMIYVGGFFSGADFVTAFSDTDASVGLPWGALIALIITIIYFLTRGVITFKETMELVVKGFHSMVPALLILTFAITLKNMTGFLGADAFVDGIMRGSASGLQNFLPAIVFVIAIFLAFSTGTSWGTFGILIPIVAAVFSDNPQLMTISISACLAGAVCGDHCSPISDTTIMSSTGAGCNHVDHVATQLPYVMTVAAISFITYIIAGFVQNAVICLIIGVCLTLSSLFVIRKISQKGAAKI